MATSYETDLVAWAKEQAELLRAGKLSDVDIENIAEEIESLGRSDKRELTNRLRELLMHMLRWIYQPERRSASWLTSIVKQQQGIEVLLDDSPSLRPLAAELVAPTYEKARRLAARETNLEIEMFPAECPWTFDQALALADEIR